MSYTCIFANMRAIDSPFFAKMVGKLIRTIHFSTESLNPVLVSCKIRDLLASCRMEVPGLGCILGLLLLISPQAVEQSHAFTMAWEQSRTNEQTVYGRNTEYVAANLTGVSRGSPARWIFKLSETRNSDPKESYHLKSTAESSYRFVFSFARPSWTYSRFLYTNNFECGTSTLKGFVQTAAYGSWIVDPGIEDATEIHRAPFNRTLETVTGEPERYTDGLVYFCPNYNAIADNSVILAELLLTHQTHNKTGCCIRNWHDTAKQTLRIFIRKSSLSLAWDNGVQVEPNLSHASVSYAGESSALSDLQGTITSFPFESPPHLNKLRFETFEADSLVEADSIADNQWNASDFANPVATDQVSQFPGMETSVGASNKLGAWYIANPHAAARKFLFRPNEDAIKELENGTTAASYLRVTLGYCAESECDAQSNSVGTTYRSMVVGVRISNQTPTTPVDLDVSEIQKKYSATLRSILQELFKSMHMSTTDALRARVEQTFSGMDSASLTLNGQDAPTDYVAKQLKSFDNESLVAAEVLDQSSFAVPVLYNEHLANPVTVWGTGDFRFVSVDDDSDPFVWDGQIYGGQAGVDVHFNKNLLLGFAYSWFTGSADYTFDDGRVTFEGTQNAAQYGFHPFAAWRSQDKKTEIWGSIGFGSGVVSVDIPVHGLEKAGTNYYTFNVGGSNIVYSFDGNEDEDDSIGSPELKLIGDAWTAKNSISANRHYIAGDYAELHQMRLMAEGTYPTQLEDGALLKPKLGLAARLDSGDAYSGFGLEGVGELFYEVDPKVAATASGNLLLFHNNLSTAGGIQAKLHYVPDRKGLGKQASLSTRVGELDAGAIQNLWDNGFAEDLSENRKNPMDMRIDAELGYGMDLWRDLGVSTPYLGQSIINGREVEYNIGNRLSIGQNMNFELKSSFGAHLDDGQTAGINFGGNVNW